MFLSFFFTDEIPLISLSKRLINGINSGALITIFGGKRKGMKYATALEKCFDKCNLIGENVDIWQQMMRYKALREASEVAQEEAYISIATRLGFISNYWIEGEQDG